MATINEIAILLHILLADSRIMAASFILHCIERLSYEEEHTDEIQIQSKIPVELHYTRGKWKAVVRSTL